MSKFIVIEGDDVMFVPMFPPAVVTVKPGKTEATGEATFDGKKVCVEGDEAKVEVPGCPYMTPTYPIVGTGKLTIDKLDSAQVAEKTNSGGKPVILEGITFKAKFTVESPAQMPPPASTPDPKPDYGGEGMFIASNRKFKGA